MIKGKEIDLAVSCYGNVKGVKYDIAILPWGGDRAS